MTVNLVWITPDAERLIGYCARVSNPSNQDNPDVAGLLKYCAKHRHWSVFEMASMCIGITTSRVIADQILRHRSFSFQVFSTRYSQVQAYIPTKPRRQAVKNRQSSVDDLPDEVAEWFTSRQSALWADAMNAYDTALNMGIARENARDLLPFSAASTMYMSGTIRSWIHYLQLRTMEDTQKEHRDIAVSIQRIFSEELPIISGVLFNAQESTDG